MPHTPPLALLLAHPSSSSNTAQLPVSWTCYSLRMSVLPDTIVQCSTAELSAVLKWSNSALPNEEASKHRWPLCTWNVICTTEKLMLNLIVISFNLNSHTWQVATVLHGKGPFGWLFETTSFSGLGISWSSFKSQLECPLLQKIVPWPVSISSVTGTYIKKYIHLSYPILIIIWHIDFPLDEKLLRAGTLAGSSPNP